jgi:hypothetical protein
MAAQSSGAMVSGFSLVVLCTYHGYFSRPSQVIVFAGVLGR